jgi:glycosyltransferase involved in cell wall biosynthesis
MAKGISVIIACYNSEKVIATTLRHLQLQNQVENILWEIILVDNNSSDNTASKAQEVWSEDPIVPLNIIFEKEIGEANARKSGIKAAKYEILSVVDDDNWVDQNWIFKINEYFLNEEIGLIGCAGEGVFEEDPPMWFEQNQHAFAIGRLYEGSFVDITDDALVPGAGLSLRKNIYDRLLSLDWTPLLTGRVGNKQSAGADSEMCMLTRLFGYKVYYSTELRFKHFTSKNRITWERLEKMTEGFGQSDVFILPYSILYKESKGKGNFLLSLRKKWWFNYLGKKIALALTDPFPFFRKSAFDSKILIRIRNNAFCATIWKERKKFEESFKMLEELEKKCKIQSF